MIESPLVRMLGRFLDVSAQRHQLIASNLANIDTPGYRTRYLDFRAALEQAEGPTQFADFSPPIRQVQGLTERPDGNNVSMERESLLMAHNQLLFQTSIQLLRVEFRKISTAINEGR
jgi:flagellar basal-body rod protein FlgB